MKNFTAALLILIAFSSVVNCQKELNFDFDYARFKYDSTADYIEFYYNLNPKGMMLSEENDKRYADAIVHIEMKNTATDSFFINKNWELKNAVNYKDTINVMNNFTGAFGLKIPSGNYSLTVQTSDANNKQFTKTINDKITIDPYKNDKFSISDIQLASNIRKEGADTNSIFYKNTLEVLPNPSMLYTNNTPVVFFYAELYNLKLPSEDQSFTLQRLLYNSQGVNVYKNVKPVKQAQNSVVEIGLINLSKYPTDSYNLVLSLIDNSTNQAFVSSKRFFLYNPNVVDSSAIKAVNANTLGSQFGIMNMEECDKMFAEAKYIAVQAEIDRYENLDSLDAKRIFLANFWKNRDTDPSTPQNEFENDYMKRVEYANSNFRQATMEGYKTDRGRIYLTYGEPDQRDYYPNESSMKPYEVWFYNNIEGGVAFYFGDVTGFGNYQLLNSTKRGEVKDDNWMNRLRTY